MKKPIFLSFRPEFFKPILYGMKKYEYRKRFSKEETTAFLYLSSPIQQVVGIIEFGKPLYAEELLKLYGNKTDTHKRLLRCLQNKEHCVVPIESLQLFKEPISMKELKDIDSNFKAPRSYYNLENFLDIFEFLKSRELYEIEFYNDHSKVFEDNIGMLCIEMEKTTEYKEKDKVFRSNPKYKKIKIFDLN